MTTRLFGRSWSISVGDTLVSDTESGLACDFQVKKTLKAEPNTCSLKVFNLSPDTRNRLTKPKRVSVRIEAGYGDSLSQIYLGDVRSISPGEIQGPNIVTDLSSGDGEKAVQASHMYVPMGAKTSNGVALKAIAKALGVKAGNVGPVAARLASKGSAVFPRATVLTGNVARVLTDFCRSAGLEWSIQDGAVQVLDIGAALETHPYVLSADSGLIGAPTIASDGKVSAQTLMIPELRPGMRVMFESLTVTGVYRINEADYSGQTHGTDWTIKITCDAPRKKV